jgi:hypothetical protein
MKKQKITVNVLKFTLLSTIVFSLLSLTGCSVINFAKKEGPPSNAEIIGGYYRITLKISAAADTLDEITLPEYEQLSQTKNVVAAAGQKKGGYKTWTKIVAFDENESTAKRKYLILEDEKPKTLFSSPNASAYIECQMVISKDVQDAPYANQTAKLIAVLKDLQKKTSKDIAEVSADNKIIKVCGGLLNQSLYTATSYLQASPSETAKLNSAEGVKFSHISLDQGVIHMGIDYDIVTVQIKLGSFTKKWKLSLEKDIEKEEPLVW